MSTWQPIETAPKDGTLVLLFEPSRFGDDGSIAMGSFRVDSNEDHHDDESLAQWLDTSYDDFSCGLASCPVFATHWMPLPPPPKKD